MIKQRSGFTLLETALVVAIATLLFMAVVVGFGGRIATGRYDTAAAEATEYLREVYTAALNTENSRVDTEGAREYCTVYSALSDGFDSDSLEKLYMSNSGETYYEAYTNDQTAFYPGRTNCAIYGKILFFGVSGDLEGEPSKVHVFDIVGNVVTGARQQKPDLPNPTTDLEQLSEQEETIAGKKILDELEYVRADFRAVIPEDEEDNSNCLISPAAGYTTYDFDWYTFPQSANYENKDFVGFAMIVRSPLSGNVSTLFYERPSSAGKWNLELYQPIANCNALGPSSASMVNENSPIRLLQEAEEQVREYEDTNGRDFETGFCLNSSDLYVSLLSRHKFVEFIEGGQNASAIKLNETDIKRPAEGYNPCI